METKTLNYLKKLAARYNHKSIAIIDQTICCYNGHVITGDFEHYYMFKDQLWDEGVYDILGRRTNEVEDYPRPDTGNLTFIAYMPSITPLAEYVPYCSKDEFRPVMGCVFFDEKNIVASDAHVLRCEKHNINVKEPFMLYAKFAKELAGLLKFFNKPVDVYANSKYLVFENEYFQAIQRKVEGVYPRYDIIMPDPGDYGRKITIPLRDILAGYKESKTAKVETALRFDVDNKKAFLYSKEDFSVLWEYDIAIEYDNPSEYTHLIMPLHLDSCDPSVNVKFLALIKRDTLYIHDTSPTSRAFIS